VKNLSHNINLKILFLSKYPPIEGGISSRTYWLAKALGQIGHEVHIVTNAQEVEECYRERIDDSDEQFYVPGNVCVHSTNPSSSANPMHIPTSKAYAEKLVNLAVEIIEKHDIDVIDSWYLLPYGVSGFLAKTITAKPQILRHAGSDIGRLFSSPSYQILFRSLFKQVDKIVTYLGSKDFFIELGVPDSKLVIIPKVNVDPSVFNPDVKPLNLSQYSVRPSDKRPVITYIGKIPYLWESRGIGELIESASKIKEDFVLLFCANGTGKEKFLEFVRGRKMENRIVFIDFLPPWRIPALIKASTCVIVPERDFPVSSHLPNLPLEVMAVGKCLVLSTELHQKDPYNKLIDNESALIADPRDINLFKKTLEKVIKNPSRAEEIGSQAYSCFRTINNYSSYIDQNIVLYEEVFKRASARSMFATYKELYEEVEEETWIKASEKYHIWVEHSNNWIDITIPLVEILSDEEKSNSLVFFRLVELHKLLYIIHLNVCGGTYHLAIRELRYALESMIQAFCLDIEHPKTTIVCKLEIIKELEKLVGRKLIKRLEIDSSVKQKASEIYSYLSKFIHSSYKELEPVIRRGKVDTRVTFSFDKELFDICERLTNEVMDVLYYLIFMRFLNLENKIKDRVIQSFKKQNCTLTLSLIKK
jgi:glycosyltransferase involved in cell wall biosynthesis